MGAGLVNYNWLPIPPLESDWYLVPAGIVTAYNAVGEGIPNGGLLMFIHWTEVFNAEDMVWPVTFTRRGVLKTFWPAVTPREFPVVYPLLKLSLTIRAPKGELVLRTPRRCNPKKGWKSSVRTKFLREAPGVFKKTTKQNTVRIAGRRASSDVDFIARCLAAK